MYDYLLCILINMTFAVFSEDSKFVNAVVFRPFHVIASASFNVSLDHILCTYLFPVIC